MMKNEVLRKSGKTVWDKIIAAAIFSIVSQILILIWGWVTSLPFKEVYKIIFIFLFKYHTISNLSILLLFSILVILLVRLISSGRTNLSYQIINKEKPRTIDNKKKFEKERLIITEEPTIFFDDRFCAAFPGMQQRHLNGLQIRKK